MTKPLRRLPSAIADADAVWDYIAQDNPQAADRTVARLVAATARLGDFPASGTPRPDIHSTARSIAVGAYLILYRIADDAVEIVRVLHAMRDLSVVVTDFNDEASGV